MFLLDSFRYSVSGLVVSWVTYLATNNFVVTMNKISGYAHAQAWSHACQYAIYLMHAKEQALEGAVAIYSVSVFRTEWER